jgi:hypothetical protein
VIIHVYFSSRIINTICFSRPSASSHLCYFLSESKSFRGSWDAYASCYYYKSGMLPILTLCTEHKFISLDIVPGCFVGLQSH